MTLALLLILSTTLTVSIANAQTNEATIIILPSAGGTVSPEPDSYTYPEGT